MLYLIGGPPRCGKTTLSAALAVRLQIPYFSIDHIASVIPPYISAERQDESFPLRALRDRLTDNDSFFAAHSSQEIVAVYRKQAATVWPGIKNFINYAIEDEHSLILEGWQLLPRFLTEVPRSDTVRIRYLYKTDVDLIVSGLKANNPLNDWVLRHTREDETFRRIAEMISCFGLSIAKEAFELGFPATNMDQNFAAIISKMASSS